MNNFEFVKGYRDIATYRSSFNVLTRQTYDFDFENWYQQGYWGDAYNPYSFADGGKIIANVSVNKMKITLDGNDMNAIQLGTVMTDEEYRNRGLSRDLMNIILPEYENTCDFIYLFANQSVLDFYPKFGFKKVTEYECRITANGKTQGIKRRKLNADNAQDKAILFRLIDNMLPSGRIGCQYNKGLVMFYCATIFKEHIYYLPDKDIAVIAHEIDGMLHIPEVFSDKEFDLDSVVGALTDKTAEIVLGFTPKHHNNCMNFTVKSDDDDTLFIRSKRILNLDKGMFPVLSHT